jgi:hypothetical protein
MSLFTLEIVEIIEITLIFLENVQNESMCCRNCRKYLYLFRKSRKLIYRNCRKLLICVPQAEAKAQAQAQAEAQPQALAARAGLEAYVTPQLLGRDINRRHRRSCPPSSERMVDTCVLVLRARCC